ncbi:hypothetical protein [Streptomyces fodineus]|uniref:hypothetical protein n=1 Tax=Streptomyces fodineus TaxID=1904616 RepID=UPI00131C057C|nr:hypothetical protein [Streptomyces fodineus]
MLASTEEVDAVDEPSAYAVRDQHTDRVVGQAVGDLLIDHPVALGEPADDLGTAPAFGELGRVPFS